MSGGAWDYLSYRFEEAIQSGMIIPTMEVMGQIEHELDWAVSCDTCRECAEMRVIAALIQFFEDGATSSQAAVAILRDGKQNVCDRCKEWRNK